MAFLPKCMNRLNAIPMKMPQGFLGKNQQGDSNNKIYMEIQRTKIAKTTLKKNTFVEPTLPDFKICYTTVVINTVWYS